MLFGISGKQLLHLYLCSRIFTETGTHRGTIQQTNFGSFRQTGDSAHYREPQWTADHRSQSYDESRRRAPSWVTDGHCKNISRQVEGRALHRNPLLYSRAQGTSLNGAFQLRDTRGSCPHFGLRHHRRRVFFSDVSVC